MKNIYKLILTLLLLFFPLRECEAGEWYFEFGKFVLGGLTSTLTHELGHAAVAETMGGDVVGMNIGLFSGATTIRYKDPASKKRAGLYVAPSGLIASSAVTEVIIQKEEWHSSSYAHGFIFSSLLSNLLHVYGYYTREVSRIEDGNDIDFFESYGGNPHIYSGLILGYTVLSIYRINTKTNIVPFFKESMFGVKIKL